MLNRRLFVLLALFLAGFVFVGFRLAKMQISDASHWQEELRAFVHRQTVIETARGAIQDRNGVVLAEDVVCDDLAIDYRAMNLDDRWLSAQALKRLKAENVTDRDERQKRYAQLKEEIAARIDLVPEVVSEVCKLPKEEVLARFQDIRERIHQLHEDRWSRRYARTSATQPGDTAADDSSMDESSESNESIDASFHQDEFRDERVAHTIVHNLPNEIANYFRQHADDYPGLVVIDNANTRHYPNGDVACHVIGMMRNVTSDKLAQPGARFDPPKLLTDTDPGNLHGYLAGDVMGESGAEKLLEDQLRGTRGVQLYELGAAGGGGGVGGPTPEKRIDPISGKNVRLTIDAALQSDIMNAMKDPSKHLMRGQDKKDHFVALVVLSLDGQVLSMISWPTFDLNTADADRVALNTDEYRRPLANRTLDAYQPGSTVKPLLAAGGLTDGVITADTVITCNGYLFPNRPNAFRCSIYQESHGALTHGPLDLEDAIAQSCNIYFYTLGSRLGLPNLVKWFSTFGLGSDTGFPLYESNGVIPKADGNGDVEGARTESLFLGIGQGRITATPLQMANAYATLLRGGLAVAPRLVLDEAPRTQQRVQLSPQVVATVREGMERVVTSGTGKDIFSGIRLPLAGKTGTADTSRPAFDDEGHAVFDPEKPLSNRDGTPRVDGQGRRLYGRASASGTDAWFVGYAPADRPQFVIAAVMEFGGYGGKAAAPLVRETLLALERHNYLPKADVQ